MNEIIEEYLLGSMMTEPRCVVIAMKEIQASAFIKTSHQIIYGAIIDSYKEFGKCGPVLVCNQLEISKNINRVGGITELYDMVSIIAETDSFPHYIGILKDKWTRRRLQQYGTILSQRSQDESKSVLDITSDTFKFLSSIQSDDITHSGTIQEIVTDIQEEMLNPDKSIGLTTGFLDLDLMTGGFRKGEMIIVAALSSMGKSAFVGNIILNCSLIHDIPTLLFSLEMPRHDYIKRLIAAESKTPFSYIRMGYFLNAKDYERGINTVNKPKLTVIAKPDISISEIKSECMRYRYEHPDLGLIAVDYLQLIRTEKQSIREQEVGSIGRGLKTIARDLNVPLIAVSPISRAIHMTPNKRPEIDHLRESGCLAGDTKIIRADTNEKIAISDLVGQTNIPVHSLNRSGVVVSNMSKVFCSGRKRLYTLKTESGMKIQATLNHPFLARNQARIGWLILDELSEGQEILCFLNGKTVWDKIKSISISFCVDVFDATVDNTHNFLANDIFVHNSLGYESDLVIFLHRDSYWDELNDDGTIEVIIRKNRNGPTGTIKLEFDKQTLKFRNMI